MRWFSLIILGPLLTVCGLVPEVSMPTAVFLPTGLPATATSASATFTPSRMPPTATDTPTQTLTATFTEIPTEPSTVTPTETAASFTYIFPLQPPSAAGFAEGTASHGYPATDIFAPAGTHFVAVINGVVDFVSYEDKWDPAKPDMTVAGGLCVAIIGDDGVRYYGSHLEAIADGIMPGVRVTAGQLLGLVGNTGNARGKDTHLHFGISRPSTPDDWKARRGQVDPLPFLVAWRDGQDLTPPLPEP